MNVFEGVATAVLASLTTGGIVGYIAKILLDKTIEHKLRLHETRQNILWENEIAYRKAQLEELYGPIYSMLKTSATLHRLWMNNKIYEVNFNVKKYFEENNTAIRRILMQKMHLLDGGEMPPQLIDFMTSAMLWNWYCAKDSEAEFPAHVKQLQEVQWPEHFEKYIFTKTEELKQRLEELYRKNRIE